MEQDGSKGSAVLGNTNSKTLTVKRESACKKYSFTLNNYSNDEYESLVTFFKNGSNKFIIGKEKGEQGTPHLQGYVEFSIKKRITECKHINKRIHWEQSKGTQEDNLKYCSKEGDYILDGFWLKKPLKILSDDKLKDWQKEIIEIVKKEPDDRKIYWYWEETGGIGKTTFSKYLSHHYGAIPVEGKKNDILFCAANFEADIYIFDFERSMEEYISYGGIEKIKNGYYMCAKYESKPIVRNPPHIFIFANFPPETKMLSLDRWVIKYIE